MAKTILFEGKVMLGDKLVDFRIYKNEDKDIMTLYSFEINPEVRDEKQIGYHTGTIQRATTLERLFSQFREFQSEFKKIIESRLNENF